jgi:hypothetical protein
VREGSQLLDLRRDVGGGALRVREEHRGVVLVEEVVVDAGEPRAEAAIGEFGSSFAAGLVTSFAPITTATSV